jgi:dopachrome tautomerase
MKSFSEFAVSTRVLRNESLATRSYHDSDFKVSRKKRDNSPLISTFRLLSSSKLIGNRGNNSQSTMHGVHQKTGIMFFAEINKNAVSCWNTKKSSLMPSKVGQIAQDDVNLIYPSDLNVSLEVEEKDFFIFMGMRKQEGRTS